MIDFDTFNQRLRALRTRVETSARQVGREPAEVRILPVTKTHPVQAAEWAARAGFQTVGENKVQEAAQKRPQGPPGLQWELIGHLQSNKARQAVETFDVIQTVDSIKLVERLDRHAGEAFVRPTILLQVNAGRDPGKYGIDPADIDPVAEAAAAAAHLDWQGLMTIAPLPGEGDSAERTFERLREAAERLRSRLGLPLPELSMGMTDDLEAAIAAGSTCLRIGTALFGPRPTAPTPSPE